MDGWPLQVTAGLRLGRPEDAICMKTRGPGHQPLGRRSLKDGRHDLQSLPSLPEKVGNTGIKDLSRRAN